MSKHPFRGLRLGYYGVILVDAPARFETYSKATEVVSLARGGKAPTSYYRTMTYAELAALPIKDLAAPDCVVFSWGTWPLLKQSIALVEAWGFTYKTCGFSWMKRKTAPMSNCSHARNIQAGIPGATRQPNSKRESSDGRSQRCHGHHQAGDGGRARTFERSDDARGLRRRPEAFEETPINMITAAL